MNRRTFHGLNVVAGWVLCFVTATLSAQEQPPAAAAPEPPEVKPADVAMKIRDAVEKLQKLRETRRSNESQHLDEIAVVDRHIDALRRDLESVERGLNTERQEIAALEGKIAEQKKLAETARAWIEWSAKSSAATVEKAVARVEKSAGPKQGQRTAEFRKSIALLQRTDSKSQVEGIQTYTATLGDEWLPARSTILSNESIMLDGDKQMEFAWMFNIGLATKMFVSEDKKSVGLWAGGSEGAWRTDLPAGVRRQTQQVLAVAREELPSAITPIPVWLPPAKASEPAKAGAPAKTVDAKK